MRTGQAIEPARSFMPLAAPLPPLLARAAFKLDASALGERFMFSTGTWGTTYHRFCVAESGGKLYLQIVVQQGGQQQTLYPTVLLDSVAPWTWYVVELLVACRGCIPL